MKTKPFLLATSGKTVDGRNIDDKMIREMASSYNPATYGARVNIEHIRGISGEGPFRAYGDILEVSTGEVDVDFNGRMEKRLGLYGVFDVTDDAKRLNQAGQKVYPSIEIEPNFAGKGFAYLMGCALTDSPAAIATERLQFNRSLPGTLNVSRDVAAPLEFADDTTEQERGGFLSALSGVLDKFAEKFAAKEPPVPDPKPAAEQPAAFDFAQLRPMFEEMGTAFAASIAGLRTELREDIDALAVKVGKVEEARDATPAPHYRTRPPADGNAGQYAGIF